MTTNIKYLSKEEQNYLEFEKQNPNFQNQMKRNLPQQFLLLPLVILLLVGEILAISHVNSLLISAIILILSLPTSIIYFDYFRFFFTWQKTKEFKIHQDYAKTSAVLKKSIAEKVENAKTKILDELYAIEFHASIDFSARYTIRTALDKGYVRQLLSGETVSFFCYSEQRFISLEIKAPSETKSFLIVKIQNPKTRKYSKLFQVQI